MADLRLLTWNLRGASFDDGVNAWSARRALVRETLQAGAAEVLLVQECEMRQLDELAQWLPHHDWYPGCPCNRSGRVFFCAIGVDSGRVVVRDGWSRYLGRPWSWRRDGGAARIHVATALHLAQPAPLLVINTHLDHRDAAARERGLAQIAAWAATAADSCIGGDFNADLDSDPLFARAAPAHRDVLAGLGGRGRGTCHGFAAAMPPAARLDGFLWAGPAWQALTGGVIESGPGPVFASDHCPVWVDGRHA